MGRLAIGFTESASFNGAALDKTTGHIKVR
jgi:hypothetical protein